MKLILRAPFWLREASVFLLCDWWCFYFFDFYLWKKTLLKCTEYLKIDQRLEWETEETTKIVDKKTSIEIAKAPSRSLIRFLWFELNKYFQFFYLIFVWPFSLKSFHLPSIYKQWDSKLPKKALSRYTKQGKIFQHSNRKIVFHSNPFVPVILKI